MGTSFYFSFMYPTIAFILGLAVFVNGRKYYTVRPPTGSILTKSFDVIRSAWRNRHEPMEEGLGFLFHADEQYSRIFVADLSQALKACKVFLLFPVYWLLYNQMQSNFVAQGEWMDRPKWLTPEQLNLVDAIIIVCLIPVFDGIIFPGIRKLFNVRLGQIARIAIGFVIAGAGFVYCAFLQGSIAKRGHWDDKQNYILTASKGVSIWLQIPPYIFIAISEIFSAISALEFAYAQAPKSMKSIIMAIFLLTNAGGAILGLILTPFFVPQNFEIIFYSFSGGMLVLAVVFWKFFGTAYEIQE